MNLEEQVARIAESLGIPKRIFLGEPQQSWTEYSFAKFDYKSLEKSLERRFILPLLERNFPEMFWELAFVMSPGIRVMKRREKPIQINWE